MKKDPLQGGPTAYELLGIEPGAGDGEIDQAETKDAGDPRETAAAAEQLRDPARRALVDLFLYQDRYLDDLAFDDPHETLRETTARRNADERWRAVGAEGVPDTGGHALDRRAVVLGGPRRGTERPRPAHTARRDRPALGCGPLPVRRPLRVGGVLDRVGSRDRQPRGGRGSRKRAGEAPHGRARDDGGSQGRERGRPGGGARPGAPRALPVRARGRPRPSGAEGPLGPGALAGRDRSRSAPPRGGRPAREGPGRGRRAAPGPPAALHPVRLHRSAGRREGVRQRPRRAGSARRGEAGVARGAPDRRQAPAPARPQGPRGGPGRRRPRPLGARDRPGRGAVPCRCPGLRGGARKGQAAPQPRGPRRRDPVAPAGPPAG